MGDEGRKDEPLELGAEHQLFLDDYMVAERKRLALRVLPVRKHPGNPVIHPEESWEPHGYITFGSVVFDDDEGQFKAWCYGPHDGEAGGSGGRRLGGGLFYFTSDDGVHWQRPDLDVVQWQGRRTNCVALTQNAPHPDCWPHCQEFFGVSKDPRDPDPDRRYKMGYLYLIREYDGDDYHSTYPGAQRGLGVAFSADGVHWTPQDRWVTHATGDGCTYWLWDDRRDRWVMYGRGKHVSPQVREKWGHLPGFAHHWGRAVMRSESEGFLHWEPELGQLVLAVDTGDGPNHETYGMHVFAYEGLYVGLVQMFHNYPEDVYMDIQLAVSRDGVHFSRLDDRSAFIPVGHVGDWDRMNNSPANSAPIRMGDELWFYYGGRNCRHSSPYRFADDGRAAGLPYTCGVGLGVAQVDRLAGLAAGFDGGRLLTRPVVLSGEPIHVNADVAFGALKVSLVDERTMPIAGMETIIQGVDSLDHVLQLPGLQECLGQPVRLSFELINGHLYSFWAGGTDDSVR